MAKKSKASDIFEVKKLKSDYRVLSMSAVHELLGKKWRNAEDTSCKGWKQYDPCNPDPSGWNYSDLIVEKGHFHLCGLDFVCTCAYVPEQYDVYHDERKIGYLRLRSGNWSVDWLPTGKMKYRETLLKKSLNPWEGVQHDRYSCLHHFPDGVMRGIYMRHAAELLYQKMCKI